MNKRVLDYYTGMSKFWGRTNVSSWKTCYGIASMDVVSRERFWKGKLLENLHNKMSKRLSRYNSRIDSIFLFFFLSYPVNFKNFKNFVRRKQRGC